MLTLCSLTAPLASLDAPFKALLLSFPNIYGPFPILTSGRISHIHTPDLGFEKGGGATKHRLLEEPGGMDFDRRLICYSDYFKTGGDKTQVSLLERSKDKARSRRRVRKKEVAEGEHSESTSEHGGSTEGAYRRNGL